MFIAGQKIWTNLTLGLDFKELALGLLLRLFFGGLPCRFFRCKVDGLATTGMLGFSKFVLCLVISAWVEAVFTLRSVDVNR